MLGIPLLEGPPTMQWLVRTCINVAAGFVGFHLRELVSPFPFCRLSPRQPLHACAAWNPFFIPSMRPWNCKMALYLLMAHT